jgi:hypothetical protein
LLRAFPGAAVVEIKRIKMNAHTHTSLTQSNKETRKIIINFIGVSI